MKQLVFAITLLLFGVTNAQQTTVYLLGDAGLLNNQSGQVFSIFSETISTEDSTTAVLILGDNIYPNGLLKESDQPILDQQLDALGHGKGLRIVLPGNHDWGDGGKKGLEAIQRQEHYVEHYNDSSILFSPIAGTPGPEVFHLSPEVVLMTIDSQWWIHAHDKNTACESCSNEAFIQQVDSVLKQNASKKIIVAAHHPLYTLGKHGAHTSLKDHFIPFPIVGSFLVLRKKLKPKSQDVNGKKYRLLKRELTHLFESYPGLIYVSGHDHSLQYLHRKDNHYIISGSVAKSSYVRKGKKGDYCSSKNGFMKLILTEKKNKLTIIDAKGDSIKYIEF